MSTKLTSNRTFIADEFAFGPVSTGARYDEEALREQCNFCLAAWQVRASRQLIRRCQPAFCPLSQVPVREARFALQFYGAYTS